MRGRRVPPSDTGWFWGTQAGRRSWGSGPWRRRRRSTIRSRTPADSAGPRVTPPVHLPPVHGIHPAPEPDDGLLPPHGAVGGRPGARLLSPGERAVLALLVEPHARRDERPPCRAPGRRVRVQGRSGGDPREVPARAARGEAGPGRAGRELCVRTPDPGPDPVADHRA